ncbi:hypothetical protein BBJ28_00013805 [Nothophytophthora sp. Chile5]|nr:hypothetical protein BBJ28_00013805 [Nothophytophthora sp. Chile5]
MTSGDEGADVLEDADAICGWGLGDCDDQLPGRRPAAERAGKAKRRAARAHGGGSSGSGLPTLRSSGKQKPTPPSPPPAPPRLRKPPPTATEPSELWSPRTLATFSEEKAEAGRQRRLKAAASIATRKTSAVAIVSASFDLESDDDHDAIEPETTPRRLPREEEEARHAVVLPRASMAAAATVPVPLLALSLPLLSIVPSCGGNAARLPLQDVQSSGVPLGRRQQRSLLAAKDAGASFPLPSGLLKTPRRSQSEAKRGKQGSSAFTAAVRVPLAPRRLPVKPLSGRLLPQIHRVVGLGGGSSSLGSGEDAVESPKSPEAKRSEHDAAPTEEEADDESWTRCYDDPELLASSMAGLIQALSTFAATTQQAKGRKKRRKKRKQQLPLQTGPSVVGGVSGVLRHQLMRP